MRQSLYQLNTRTYLSSLKPSATLDDIPDKLLESLAADRFSLLWLLGVWETGTQGRKIALNSRNWQSDFAVEIPDFSDADITASPFAISAYSVASNLGGNQALGRFRDRLARYGIKLILDFIPNHIGFDHPWINTHPDFLITGDSERLASDPGTWTRLTDGRVVAFGRDPNFPGWTDTLQLNYANPKLREAMLSELSSIANLCDGVRCDMAMLIEPEVFKLTWGDRASDLISDYDSFWRDSTRYIRESFPNFIFLAEVYWDYEYRLQQLGFDYTYDKTLYDRVVSKGAKAIREHLHADISYQDRMARFLENHDEPRVASCLSNEQHRAAALITYLSPGLKFFHDGQLSGKTHRIPVQLRRAPSEEINGEIAQFYSALLPLVNSEIARSGSWRLLSAREAWPGSTAYENFVVFYLDHPSGKMLISVNYGEAKGVCFIDLNPLLESMDLRSDKRSCKEITFRDLLSQDSFQRPISDLMERGLYIECDGWHAYAFIL